MGYTLHVKTVGIKSFHTMPSCYNVKIWHQERRFLSFIVNVNNSIAKLKNLKQKITYWIICWSTIVLQHFFERESDSATQIDLAIFEHWFLQKCLKSVRLWGISCAQPSSDHHTDETLSWLKVWALGWVSDLNFLSCTWGSPYEKAFICRPAPVGICVHIHTYI